MVFIGGSGRSGTTYVYQLLAAQDGVASFGDLEAKFIVEADGLIDLYRALVSDYNASRSRAALSRFEHLMSIRLTDPDYYGQASIAERFAAGGYERAVLDYVKSLQVKGVPRRLTRSRFFDTTREFVEGLVAHLAVGERCRLFVEKTPHNILHVKFLLALFPRARVINVVRDPRGVVLSLRRQTWAPSTVDGCAHWLREVYKAYDAQMRQVDASRICTVRLEDICDHTSATLQILADFCDLPQLESEKVPPDPLQAFRWQSQISFEESETIDRILGDCVERYGYQRGATSGRVAGG
jgi:hypothetical protein